MYFPKTFQTISGQLKSIYHINIDALNKLIDRYILINEISIIKYYFTIIMHSGFCFLLVISLVVTSYLYYVISIANNSYLIVNSANSFKTLK